MNMKKIMTIMMLCKSQKYVGNNTELETSRDQNLLMNAQTNTQCLFVNKTKKYRGLNEVMIAVVVGTHIQNTVKVELCTRACVSEMNLHYLISQK